MNSILNNGPNTSSLASSDALTSAPAPPNAPAPPDAPALTSAPAPPDAPYPSDVPAPTNTPAPPDAPAHRPTDTLPKKRCRKCIADVNQLDISERKSKVTKLNPVITKWALCSGSVCKNHYISVCTECRNNLR